ncbi:Cupredoxin [Trichocladium antarcticum]|uniref:Cupredoxin n=1 Tax=Trichocladium antarcticum TaxID=1450529 RepID=A0AAN6UN41_9PEZI|nr:Cupredoxin [Trichocladium antarcticum]
MQLTTLVLAALTSLASAQKTWVVTVAQNGSLTYSPNKITAEVGEYVQFQFHAGNHTVTQSTFDAPCQPSAQHSNITGFHSGFLPAAAMAAEGRIPTYTIKVNNTNPMWLYCAQGKHCENGMVMVINEPTNPNRTLAKYTAAAAQAAAGVPGDVAGAGGQTGSTDTPTASGSATPPAASTGVVTAAAGTVAAPATFALLAAAGAAMLL